jgi:hypothetical protein
MCLNVLKIHQNQIVSTKLAQNARHLTSPFATITEWKDYLRFFGAGGGGGGESEADV